MEKTIVRDGEQALDRNIKAIHRLRQVSDSNRRLDQKLIDKTASFIGSTKSVYIHLLFYGFWLVLTFFGQRLFNFRTTDMKDDLGLIATVEAILLTVFVLVNQRRMNSLERKNSDLHMQMSLLAEHELTRIARAIDSLTVKLGTASETTDLEDVKADVDPETILDRIAKLETQAPTEMTSEHE